MSKGLRILEGPTHAEVLSGTARELETARPERLRLLTAIGNLALSTTPDELFFLLAHREIDRLMVEKGRLQRLFPC